MRRTIVQALAFVAAMGAGSAVAADLPRPAPVVKAPVAAPIVRTWTGCYIGGNVGGAWSDANYTLDNAVVVEDFSFNPSSVIGGVQAGCNWQFTPTWLIGIEGTWSGTDLKQTDNAVLAGPGRLRSFKTDQIATVVGRLGITFDQWLLYAKGGYAAARIDTFAINTVNNIFLDIQDWRSGVTAGAGVEYMAWQHVVLGVEFDWYNFSFDGSALGNAALPSRFFNTNADIFAVTGRISWLFN